jgi:hypothetical protein
MMSKNVSRDGRAPKEIQKETHPSVPSKCDKIQIQLTGIVPRNFAFFAVDPPVQSRQGCTGEGCQLITRGKPPPCSAGAAL